MTDSFYWPSTRRCHAPLPPLSKKPQKNPSVARPWKIIFFFFSISSQRHEFRIYSWAAAVRRLVTSQQCGCGSCPYGAIKVILTGFFFFFTFDGFHSRYFQRLQPVKKRHLWAPSASTSTEITRHFFGGGRGVAWGGRGVTGVMRGALAQIKPRRETLKKNSIFPEGCAHSLLNFVLR